MIDDIVIDTNVLVHAQNPNEKRFVDTTNLIKIILDSNTSLCVDEGFNEICKFFGIEPPNINIHELRDTPDLSLSKGDGSTCNQISPCPS